MPAFGSMSAAAIGPSWPSRASLALVSLECLFQLLAVDASPLRSVTSTCVSPVAAFSMANGTMRPALSDSLFLESSRSLRTTWSRNSSAAPSAEAHTTSPPVRTSKVRGSPSVSR